MLVMLAMTIVQRGVGFFRGIWFCRLLDDATVGQWSMAFGFITLITPVMLLGLPGSLPRYVEHFRLRGHLSPFVRRLVLATSICGVLSFLAILAVPDWFGWLIFLEPQNTSLITSVGVAVLAIIAFNFVNDLNSSLRQVRIVSLMQFMQGVGFTVIGVAWLSSGGGLSGLILCFAGATIAAILPGAWSLRSGWDGLPSSDEPFDARGMWRRLLPYAAALWAMNVLGNVFELSDRYMILHFSGVGEAALRGEAVGQAAVGQYHSGRIVPALFLSLATLISGVLLPYLSADWEAGRPDAVRGRLRRVLLALSATFTGGAAVALLLAPWLFETLLQGRYSSGLALMPMAFVFCTWSAVATVGQDYLWVCEKGKLVALVLATGLLMNILLNAWLLPLWGLHGAVTATLCAYGIVMVGIWIAMVRCGFGIEPTAAYVALLPATLLAGPWVAILCVLLTLVLSRQVKEWIAEAATAWISHRRAAAETAVR